MRGAACGGPARAERGQRVSAAGGCGPHGPNGPPPTRDKPQPGGRACDFRGAALRRGGGCGLRRPFRAQIQHSKLRVWAAACEETARSGPAGCGCRSSQPGRGSGSYGPDGPGSYTAQQLPKRRPRLYCIPPHFRAGPPAPAASIPAGHSAVPISPKWSCVVHLYRSRQHKKKAPAAAGASPYGKSRSEFTLPSDRRRRVPCPPRCP